MSIYCPVPSFVVVASMVLLGFSVLFFVAPVDFIFVSYFVIPKGFVASVAKVTSSTCQHKRNTHIIISIITQCVNRAKKRMFSK